MGAHAAQGMRRRACQAIIIARADAGAALSRAGSTSSIVVTERASRTLEHASAIMEGRCGGEEWMARQAVGIRRTTAAQAAEITRRTLAALHVKEGECRAVELAQAILE